MVYINPCAAARPVYIWFNPCAARPVYIGFNPCAARPVYIWFTLTLVLLDLYIHGLH